MTSEGLLAAGYTAIGVVGAKLVDVAIRWRAASHVTPDTELTATLTTGAELREELRKEAERLRTDRDRLIADMEKAEGEIAVLRKQIEMLRNECEDLRAELRLLRKTRLADEREREDFERGMRDRKP